MVEKEEPCDKEGKRGTDEVKAKIYRFNKNLCE
jgi:hypothetical protein